MKLEEKVAVITGSGQGIGRALALRFAREGARVVLNYPHHPDQAEALLREIDPQGRHAITVQADVASEEDCGRLIRRALDHFGGLDIVVNNVGIARRAAFLEMRETDDDAVMTVNAKGMVLVSQAAVKSWREAQRPGKIINMFGPQRHSLSGLCLLLRK